MDNTSDVKLCKLLRCPQEGCDKVFKSSPGYRYHLKSHAIDPRPHICQCCHKKFKSANGLKYHLRKAHNIEPVLSKQNLDGVVKDRESVSSEEDPFLSNSNAFHRDQMSRNYHRRQSSLSTSYAKSSMGLNYSSMKNMPGIPSPLTKSPLDMGQCMSSSSSGSGLQSPYGKVDIYQNFDKRFTEQQSMTDFSKRISSRENSIEYPYCQRSSLSEYTQQCQQANNELQQQCQRLSTSDAIAPDYPARNMKYYNNYMKSESSHGMSMNYGQDYSRHPYGAFANDNPSSTSHYGCANQEPGLSTYHAEKYKEFVEPMEGKEYPTNLATTHNPLCHGAHRKASFDHCNLSYSNNNAGGYHTDAAFMNTNSPMDASNFKMPNANLQNTEQIVPDICVSTQISPNSSACDRNNNMKTRRRGSESSTETEFSDSVFQQENVASTSSPYTYSRNHSPTVTTMTHAQEATNTSTIQNTTSTAGNATLLSRRISRTKSIPPLFIQANADKEKDLKQINNKLMHLAEVATSPRSVFHQSPLPFSLTPGLLPTSTPEWPGKSPLSKLFFPDKCTVLSTPTIARCFVETTQTNSPVTTATSLPPSPFLDNVQTPSYWPTQVWPTPVWLCFLKGCVVKFELDDKEFMKTEDVAVFCTTPGGRRRDDMNFYTSGMKVREIKEERPSVTTARDMVELTFEQIIPGPQRLVAICPTDHPFLIKNKGWSAANPSEAMARYGSSFQSLNVNDICIPASRMTHTPSCTLSPATTLTSGPQIFTFSSQDMSRFSPQTKKPEKSDTFVGLQDKETSSAVLTSRALTALHEKVAATSALLTSRNQETITLTYSKSPTRTKSPFFPPKVPAPQKSKVNGTDHHFVCDDRNEGNEPMELQRNKNAPQKKKRRKPITGNEQSRRPMNGFMLFGKTMRIELTKLYPGKDNRAISKLLGEKWRELSEQKREDFSRMAKEMADERMKLNPNCWKRKHRKDGTIKQNACEELKKLKIDNGSDLKLPPKFDMPYIKQE